MERVDLAPGAALLHRPQAPRRVVLLPGARYPTRAPLLWFARTVALSHGFGVLELLDELPDGAPDPFAWMQERARCALDHAPAEETVVIGKSLGSVAAELAVERDLPAVWLTPVLDRTPVAAVISRASRPTLLIGGSADPMWVPEALAPNDHVELVELEGLDHGLERPDDPFASLDALRRVSAALDDFLDRLS